MATCLSVITSAYRKAGINAWGVAIRPPQDVIGLEVLGQLYNSLVEGGTFGQLVDYYLAAGNYTALENQRIFKNAPASVITLPATITDAETGLVRTPLDGACIVEVDPVGLAPTTYIWDAYVGAWVKTTGLVLNDNAPMSQRYLRSLVCLLGLDLCNETGQPVTPMLAREAGLARYRFGAKFDQPRADEKLVMF